MTLTGFFVLYILPAIIMVLVTVANMNIQYREKGYITGDKFGDLVSAFIPALNFISMIAIIGLTAGGNIYTCHGRFL